MVKKQLILLIILVVAAFLIGMFVERQLSVELVQPQGRILVVESWRMDDGIYVMDAADGGNRERLTPPTILRTLESPVWSPDRESIAFGCKYYAVENHNLCVMPASGLYHGYRDHLTLLVDPNRMRQITGEEMVVSPLRSITWAPDGQRLAFIYYTPERYWACTVTLGRDLQCWRLGMVDDEWETATSDSVSVDWSPVDERLALEHDRKIYLVDPDGHNAVFLAEGRSPQWSPDGKRLLLYEGGKMAVIDRDGQNLQVVYASHWSYSVEDVLKTPFLNTFSKAAWSPDGDFVAFLGNSGKADSSDLVCTLNLQTHKVEVITPRDETFISWLDWAE